MHEHLQLKLFSVPFRNFRRKNDQTVNFLSGNEIPEHLWQCHLKPIVKTNGKSCHRFESNIIVFMSVPKNDKKREFECFILKVWHILIHINGCFQWFHICNSSSIYLIPHFRPSYFPFELTSIERSEMYSKFKNRQICLMFKMLGIVIKSPYRSVNLNIQYEIHYECLNFIIIV